MADHSARFHIPCTDAAQARILADAVAPEAAEGPEGTSATITVVDGGLGIVIDADTLSGLRAATQGLLRLIDAAIRAMA